MTPNITRHQIEHLPWAIYLLIFGLLNCLPINIFAQKEWTIMVFLNADNSLDGNAVKDFKEMAKVGSDTNLNIVVQMDRKDSDDWGDSQRFLVQKGMRPTEKNAIPNQDLGETNMGDPEVLYNFISWSMEQYPAKRYALIFWSHGNGMRSEELDNDWNNNVKESKDNSTFVLNTSEIVHQDLAFEIESVTELAPLEWISPDESEKDRLYGSEIQSLWDRPNMRKLDLLGFDACLMAMLENCYAFRNTATVMVASEELINDSGWDYEIFLTSLKNYPKMDDTTLAKEMVQSYRLTYDDNENRTLSAIRLGLVKEFADSLSVLCKLMKDSMVAERPAIMKARKRCTAFASEKPKEGFMGIDLFAFLKEYRSLTNLDRIKLKIDELLLFERRLLIRNYRGEERRYKAGQRSFGAHGISIYFPSRKEEFLGDNSHKGYLESNLKYPIEFVKNQNWDNFILSFIDL